MEEGGGVAEEGAEAFGFDPVPAAEEGVEVGEFVEPFGGGFVADAVEAGDVVGGVAGEGEEGGDLVGEDAEFFADGGGVEAAPAEFGVGGGGWDELEEVVVAVGADELGEVFVGGDEEDVVAVVEELGGGGGDEVVGFDAGAFDEGDAEGAGEAFEGFELLGEGGGHVGALGFVVGVEGGVAVGAAEVEEGGGVGAFFLVLEHPEGADPAVEGAGGEAVGAGELGHAVEGAEGEVEAVEEEPGCHEEESVLVPSVLVLSGRVKDGRLRV